MKIQRTTPPTAAPIELHELLQGLKGIFSKEQTRDTLEREIMAYFKVEHIFLVSSGKAALFLILEALKTLSPKKEVVIPAYTCFSVPSAVKKALLKIVACDINPSTLDFNDQDLKNAITEKTLCVVPGHLFGIPSDIDRIKALCKDKGIFIVEDAAQAMGSNFHEKKLGTIGDVGFFSLGRGKNITCGSGGIIVTNSDTIAKAIRQFYNRLQGPGVLNAVSEYIKMVLLSVFIHPALYWFPSGIPALKIGETVFHRDFPVMKLSGMKRCLLKKWHIRLQGSNDLREETASYFIKKLKLEKTMGSSLPYLRLPLLMKTQEDREQILSLSHKLGLGISAMYPTAINEIEEIKGSQKQTSCPSAKRVADRLITIPTHPLLSKEDKSKILDALQGMSIFHGKRVTVVSGGEVFGIL